MTINYYLIISLIVFNLTLTILFIYHLLTADGKQRELVDKLIAKDLDMLDRLMAKDLSEIKQTQQPSAPGTVTSRRRNDQRITEENAKFATREVGGR